MKFVSSIFFIMVSVQAQSAALWTDAKVDMVFAGYPDHSVAFSPVGVTVNPAGCTASSVYAIPPDHDAGIMGTSTIISRKISR